MEPQQTGTKTWRRFDSILLICLLKAVLKEQEKDKVYGTVQFW